MKTLAIVTVALLLSTCVAASANVIRNGSFENASGIYDQGQLPSDWFQVGLLYAGADTYSTDGTNGLAPGALGNFSGVGAQDGVRFVAGTDIESFGQTLTSALTPGQSYGLSAWLHRAMRYDLVGSGGYEVFLADASFANRVKVATLGPTVGPAVPTPQWEYFSGSFTAPANAVDLPVVIFDPYGEGAYIGLDNVAIDAVPEPASLMTVVAGMAGLLFDCRRRS